MIKKLFLAAAMVLPFMASAQTLKIGVVDSNEIIGKMPETTAAQNTLNDVQKKYQAELQRIEEEFQRQYEEFRNLDENEPAAIKERKASQLQETQQKYDTFQQKVMEDLQKQHDELMAPVFQKFRNAVEAVGKENGFSYIQEISSCIYFGAPVENITPLVKAKLGL
ncbi:MAG: OmpH family outer membrane protein [Muribaculaceae bacterium]|nr:OmpH family outer membrane protein [Muribaculaceae bacterium]